MSIITRPLLAGKIEKEEDWQKISFPILATPKLDGIRCLKVDGEIVSRNFKPIPNNYVRETLEDLLFSFDGVLDGELIVEGKDFNSIQSEIMREDGQPNFKYCIFDSVQNDLSSFYIDRIETLKTWYKKIKPVDRTKISLLLPKEIQNKEELEEYESLCLSQKYEGVMIRNPLGPYKCGRSTLKEGILLKIKQFVDSEAIILGFEEKLTNTNEQEKDEFGLSKRSSKKEGLVGANTLGAVLVEDIKTKIQFSIGSGFDDILRNKIWNNQKEYLGKIVSYKYQPSGAKDKPRFPVFRGIRHKNDM